ncbi:MAG TPA: nucleotidyltransferase family protein [Clostridiales bacterium]|nr:nucleotidyltransferase family protein [Clostridiales bacterium]
MQGMILAAGYGTRLRPITDSIPKALVPLSGRPVLEHIIRKFIYYGIDNIIINSHYYPEQIENFISGSNFKADIKIINEKVILGTGGGIFNMLSEVCDDDFIVYNTDVICDIDLEKLMLFHKKNEAAATMVMQDRDTFNQVIIDSEGNFCGLNLLKKGIRNIVKAPAGTSSLLAFCGIHAVNKKKIEAFRQNETEYSIIDVYLNAVRSGAKIISYKPELNWYDIGTVEKLKEAEEYLRSNPLPEIN